ncbi:hypothetical protein LX36DRAFT_657456 [Colletotrichum falcatum]|nr:hypothetical protein LX36DRAFT_657456 [Colletotrichum falcatum]
MYDTLPTKYTTSVANRDRYSRCGPTWLPAHLYRLFPQVFLFLIIVRRGQGRT